MSEISLSAAMNSGAYSINGFAAYDYALPFSAAHALPVVGDVKDADKDGYADQVSVGFTDTSGQRHALAAEANSATHKWEAGSRYTLRGANDKVIGEYVAAQDARTGEISMRTLQGRSIEQKVHSTYQLGDQTIEIESNDGNPLASGSIVTIHQPKQSEQKYLIDPQGKFLPLIVSAMQNLAQEFTIRAQVAKLKPESISYIHTLDLDDGTKITLPGLKNTKLASGDIPKANPFEPNIRIEQSFNSKHSGGVKRTIQFTPEKNLYTEHHPDRLSVTDEYAGRKNVYSRNFTKDPDAGTNLSELIAATQFTADGKATSGIKVVAPENKKTLWGYWNIDDVTDSKEFVQAGLKPKMEYTATQIGDQFYLNDANDTIANNGVGISKEQFEKFFVSQQAALINYAE